MPRRRAPNSGIIGRHARKRERSRVSSLREHQREEQQQQENQLEEHLPGVYQNNDDLVNFDGLEGVQRLVAAESFEAALRAISINKCVNCQRMFPDLKLNTRRNLSTMH